MSTYRARRHEIVLTLLDSRADRLDKAAAELGAFFDQVGQLGIRGLVAQAERDHQ
jgi:hypothetical protein